jgi:hypothetical protein
MFIQNFRYHLFLICKSGKRTFKTESQILSKHAAFLCFSFLLCVSLSRRFIYFTYKYKYLFFSSLIGRINLKFQKIECFFFCAPDTLLFKSNHKTLIKISFSFSRETEQQQKFFNWFVIEFVSFTFFSMAIKHLLVLCYLILIIILSLSCFFFSHSICCAHYYM